LSDVFISYAHSTARQARAAADALRAAGYSVWIDDDLLAHRVFSREIDAQLSAAKAALVIWSADGAMSRWVLSEANRAREDHKLVQLKLDSTPLPMPFDQIQCADLTGWTGEPAHAGWRKVVASIADLAKSGPLAPAPAAPTVRPALALPDKPSIAVLPFADPSGAAEGDYFADGMVDEIVTALGRFSALFVIGSSSSLSYRARERDVAEIGRELGVRYLLEGSVRRSGARVRVSVSLVEAASGAQVWSDRFEGGLDDVFALQDEVANAVAARLEPTIQTADLRRGDERPTADQTAYDLFLRGRQALLAYERESWRAAEAFFEQAVARDPAYALAWTYLAWSETYGAVSGWSDDRAASWRKAEAAMRQAFAAGGGDEPRAMVLLAMTSLYHGGDVRTCEAMADRALALNPSSAICWQNAGSVSLVSGHPERALERFQQALRLDPRTSDRAALILTMGSALMALERFDEATPCLEEANALRPGLPLPLFILAGAYAELGRVDDARDTLARAERLMPARDYLATAETLPAFRGEGVRHLRDRLRSLGADV
jgi:adenylate cyclase